ncbi:sugar ABC transporter substrate-binding protein [Butyricicoccus faecihominis]|uniref:sugar ABC transporter substrate-binding protein n=1 Tax=Butyricicoccus faecihominis TaxID=1712515 RepID=UPI0024783925|nr:sugar ABC transporter substrate-binding protein [Butyricicoccus faecihominis]MCQ5128874.1 sugar ABC transporter substrate-binding protein [Butyricicoccus faecihominis]
MLKKFTAALLSLLTLSLAACGDQQGSQGNASDSADSSTEKTYKIGFVANGATLWEYPKSSINFYMELQEKYPIEVVVFDAQGDAGKQSTLVGDAIAQGCDAITIIPIDNKSVIPACTEAMNAGVPVFNLGSVDMGEENAGKSFVSMIGAGSGLAASEIIGEAFVEHLEPGSKVVSIIGVAGTSETEQRNEVWQKMCEEHDIEILDVQSTDWDASKALQIMQNYLVQYPQIDGVFCQWDDGMVSVAKALEAAGRLEGTFLASIDGNKNGFDLVRDGTMYCTAAQNQKEICEKAVTTTLDYLAGNEVEPYITIPYIKITKENVDEYSPW